jgi:hypothetical protein
LQHLSERLHQQVSIRDEIVESDCWRGWFGLIADVSAGDLKVVGADAVQGPVLILEEHALVGAKTISQREKPGAD